ncbi:hypothetical protein [Microlunatus sp. GCM10028923]|uniref:hypothetical protein n=1 Tax=Microlunatus sp. GCM10028923 TaxID=3273400 RepID=UPI003620B9F1
MSLPSPGPTRPKTTAAVITAAVLAPLGGLVCGVISQLMALASVDALLLRVLFNTPISSPLRPRPLALVAMLVGFVVLAVIVVLVVWLVARAASPRYGFAALLFGGWIAAVLGGWLTALATSPLVALDLGFRPEMVEQLVLQRISAGGGWGLYWGWLTGLAAAVVFLITNRSRRGGPVPARPTL